MTSPNRPDTGRKRVFHTPKVADVEALPCPAADGLTHRLANRQLTTQCVHCGESWAELDRRARL